MFDSKYIYIMLLFRSIMSIIDKKIGLVPIAGVSSFCYIAPNHAGISAEVSDIELRALPGAGSHGKRRLLESVRAAPGK